MRQKFIAALVIFICLIKLASSDIAYSSGTEVSGTIPLTIDSVSTSNINGSSATINWKTNGDATSQVFYDIVEHDSLNDYLYQTTEDPALVSEHSKDLTGLSPGTTYHYRVRSIATINGTALSAVSGDYTFTTTTDSPLPPPGGGGGFGFPPPVDTIPPEIYSVSASNITETSADINWKTDERSNTQVEYWASPTILSELDEEMVFEHHVELMDLNPGNIYHYRSMSRDAAGNLEVSKEYTFTTLGEATTTGEATTVEEAAAFYTSGLTISPTEVATGEQVTISVLVTNTGDLTGNYEVNLKINDTVAATRNVNLSGKSSEKVTFITVQDVAGTYSVDVNGISDRFTVKARAEPSAFTFSELTISPVVVAPGEQVAISILVTNTGEIDDTYRVRLILDGTIVATKEVTIPGKSIQTVTFAISGNTAQICHINVEGLTGNFEVVEHSALNWFLTIVISAAVVIVILISYLILRFFRMRKATRPSTSILFAIPKKLKSSPEEQKQCGVILPDSAVLEASPEEQKKADSKLSDSAALETSLEDEKQADLKLFDLAAEIIRNRKIAVQQLNDEFLPFETRVWDAYRYEIHKLPKNMQDQLKPIYDDIRLANSLTWLSTKSGNLTPIALGQYMKLRSTIAERLNKIKDI